MLGGQKYVGDLQGFIQKQFLKGDSAYYTDIPSFVDNIDTRTKEKIS